MRITTGRRSVIIKKKILNPLGILSLSTGSAQVSNSITINILGATPGSTITGVVPDGMTLNSGARTISGTPTIAGTYNFSLNEVYGVFNRSTNVTIVVASANWWDPDAIIDLDYANNRYRVNGTNYASIAAMISAGVYFQVSGKDYMPLTGLLPSAYTIVSIGTTGPNAQSTTVAEYMLTLDDGDDGVSNDELTSIIRQYNSGTSTAFFGYRVDAGGSNQLDNLGGTIKTSDPNYTGVLKTVAFAARVQSGSHSMAVNGVSLGSSTITAMSAVNRMVIGNRSVDPGRAWTGTFQRVKILNKAATDFELLNYANPEALPGVPSLVIAPGDNRNTIIWSDPSAIPVITSHKIYRGTVSGSLTLLDTTTSSNYIDLTAVNGTTYYYKVSAVNSLGEGGLSTEKSATPSSISGTFDTAASALFTRSPSAFTDQEKQVYNTAIRTIKGIGMWDGLSSFVAVGSDTQKTLLNWKSSTDPTVTGSLTFNSNNNYTGDGSTGKLNLNVAVPSVNSAYMGLFATSNQTFNGPDMGGGNSQIKVKTGSGGLGQVHGSGGGSWSDPSDSTGVFLTGFPDGGPWIGGYQDGGQLVFNAAGPSYNTGVISAFGVGATYSNRSMGAWMVGSGFKGSMVGPYSALIRNFRNNQQNPKAVSTSGKTSGIVANRTYENSASQSVTVPYTYQTCHHASPQANITKIAPIWIGWWRNADQYRNNIGANITIEASVEYPAGSGTFTPITFEGGASSAVVPNGGVLKADLLTISIPSGAQFRIRTVVTAISASTWVPTYNYIQNPSSTTYADGSASGNLKTSGTISAGSSRTIWGPAAIMGELDAPNCRGYVIHGDSIATGTGDSGTGVKGGTGFIQRALDPLYPWAALTTPGAFEGNATGNLPDMNKLRALAAAMHSLGGVSHVITEGGINDLGNGSASADFTSGYNRCYSSLWIGAKYHITTMTPYSTSTDSWATPGNQTIKSGNYTTQMPLYNAAIRANPADTDGYIDAHVAAATGTDTGIWKNGYTNDGLHPNSTGHTAIAAAITIP